MEWKQVADVYGAGTGSDRWMRRQVEKNEAGEIRYRDSGPSLSDQDWTLAKNQTVKSLTKGME